MAVAYRNTRTGRVVRLAGPLPSMDRSRRWERVDEPQAAEAARPQAGPAAPWPEPKPDPDGPFDPGQHTVKQVNEHLAAADAREVERVMVAEAGGRGRRGILLGPASEKPES